MGKRGPRRKAGKREPNGQLSRVPAERNARHLDGLDQEQQSMISVGIEARQRVWGVPVGLSRDQMAGSAVGRMCLQEHITRTQYEAALSYIAEREEYSRCIMGPRQPGAVDLNKTNGASTAGENVAHVMHITAGAKATDAALREAQREVGNMGNLFGAIDAVLIRDVGLDHFIGDLRTALNALVRRYGLESDRHGAADHGDNRPTV